MSRFVQLYNFASVQILSSLALQDIWDKQLILSSAICTPWGNLMEQRTLKNVNNFLTANIYSSSETSGGQNCNLYLNVVHFFNTSVNYTSVAA